MNVACGYLFRTSTAVDPQSKEEAELRAVEWLEKNHPRETVKLDAYAIVVPAETQPSPPLSLQTVTRRMKELMTADPVHLQQLTVYAQEQTLRVWLHCVRSTGGFGTFVEEITDDEARALSREIRDRFGDRPED